LGPCYKCFGHVKVPKGYVNWYLTCYVTFVHATWHVTHVSFFFKII
jgi:hypothetical protein